jgi:hypothetical protein
MFNYSEIETSGRERLNTLQAEARQYERIKQGHRETVHSEPGHSILLRVISFIRPVPFHANGTSVKPETARQTL